MKVDFVRGSVQFMKKNLFSILMMVLILFLITSYMVLHNIVFVKTHPVLKKMVIVENFVHDNSVLPKKFCAIHLTDFKAGDHACRQLLTSDTCNLTDCCVWATHPSNGEACVSGNHLGPTFDAFDYQPDFLFGGQKYTI